MRGDWFAQQRPGSAVTAARNLAAASGVPFVSLSVMPGNEGGTGTAAAFGAFPDPDRHPAAGNPRAGWNVLRAPRPVGRNRAEGTVAVRSEAGETLEQFTLIPALRPDRRTAVPADPAESGAADRRGIGLATADLTVPPAGHQCPAGRAVPVIPQKAMKSPWSPWAAIQCRTVGIAAISPQRCQMFARRTGSPFRGGGECLAGQAISPEISLANGMVDPRVPAEAA